MRDIAWANVKLDVIEAKLLRRKAQRQADQDAEDKTENNKIVGRKLTTKRKPTTKEKKKFGDIFGWMGNVWGCLLYTSPSPRDRTRSRMPSSA